MKQYNTGEKNMDKFLLTVSEPSVTPFKKPIISRGFVGSIPTRSRQFI